MATNYIKRSSQTQQLLYGEYVDTDPLGIGNPDAGIVYRGSFGNLFWSKDSSGVIKYDSVSYNFLTFNFSEEITSPAGTDCCVYKQD